MNPTLPQIQAQWDIATGTASYLVADPRTRACAVIDSVLDFDIKSGRTSTAGVDQLIALIQAQGLDLQWILETHVHADHLSAAPYLQAHMGAASA